MENLPRLYKDLPELELRAAHIDDTAYAAAIESFVIVCADILIIDRAQKLFYLAKRKTKPNADWYMLGGRLRRGETEIAAAVRNFSRETGLQLAQDRLSYFGLRRFWWKDREQEPQDKGTDTLIFIFTVELSKEELDTASHQVDAVEYEQATGLKAFTRAELAENSLHPVLIEIYDQLF